MPRIAPVLAFAPELLLAARGSGEGIAAAIFDVDGVLTDGRVYIGAGGESFKAFSTLDGQGLKLLADGGIVPIVVTGRDSPAVRRRMADLGIGHVAYGAGDKMAAAAALVDGLDLDWEPRRRDRRRLARPADPAPRRVRLRAAARPRRGSRGGASRHRGGRGLRRRARVLRSAAGRRRPLRRALERPAVRPRWLVMTSAPGPRPPASNDDEVDLSFAGPEPVAAAPWPLRLLDLVSAYLPLLMMAVLASGTWWLVRNAPSAEAPRAAAAPRHEADYVMTRFVVQRFGSDGALRTQIEGERLRHFPDNDTLEIDDGAHPRHRQRRHRHAGHRQQGARQRRRQRGAAARRRARHATGDGKQETIEFRSEFLHAFRNVERVRSHLPVVVTQGQSVVRAARHGIRQPGAGRRSQGSHERDLHRAEADRGAMSETTPLVFITGASSGIGQALAARFHRAGYRLALVARRADEVARWAAAPGIEPARCAVYAADVRDVAAITGAGRACIDAQGLPDVVIANAGISVGMDTAVLADLEVMRATYETNNLGMAATFQPFVAADVRARRRHASSASPASPACAACPGTAPTRRARRR